MELRMQARWIRPALLALAALVAFVPAATMAAVAPLTPERIVQQSDLIVVATVIGQQSHWNEKHNLIFTDYTLRIEDLLKGEAPGVVVVSMAGGTVGEETHSTSVATPLEAGGRYLLFIHDPRRLTLSPFTGGWQGVVREGGVAGSAGSTGMRGFSSTEFSSLVEWARAAVPLAGPPEPPPAGRQVLPAKVYDPSAQSGLGGNDVRLPVKKPDAACPPPPPDPRVEVMPPEAMVVVPPHDQNRFHALGCPDWIVWNPFPFDSEWSPHDQEMMSYWNTYSYGDVHGIQEPTGTWAWRNNVFDLCGFVSEEDMIAAFGAGWGGFLGVTWQRHNVDGLLIEADIALNPDYEWTLDNELASQDTATVQSFEATLLHELGHGWGLDHPWQYQDVWWDSVMNYSSRPFRVPLLFSDDTHAAQTAYPGISIHDGIINCYTTDDDPNTNEAVYRDAWPSATCDEWSPALVEHGGTFCLINPYKIENCGTDNFIDPQVEVYLTPLRMNWSGAYYLSTLLYMGTLPPYITAKLSLGAVTIPRDVQPGDYYVGLFLRDDGDGYQSNNSAWSGYLDQVQVVSHCLTPPEYDDSSLTPKRQWQKTDYVFKGVGDCHVYRFYLEASGKYNFSLCGNDGVGGSADPGDGDLALFDPAGTQLWHIDGPSSCVYDATTRGTIYQGWSPPADGYYYLKVSEYYNHIFTFELAYREGLAGDLNLDGIVNAADLSILAGYLAGSIGAGSIPAGIDAVDINSDGHCNSRDLSSAINMVAGHISPF